MDLVEVVAHDGAAEDALAAARALCGRIDRLPAPVASAPGFLVNRVLTPYLLEAMLLLEEGGRPETVDRAATGFGMPMGPIEVADQVGLDVCLQVPKRCATARPPPAGDAGLAPGEGREGRARQQDRQGLLSWTATTAEEGRGAPDPSAAMADRLVLPMVDAAAACLREGVVADARPVDAAMVFATGFAPFRGGPAELRAEPRPRRDPARASTSSPRRTARASPRPRPRRARGDGLAQPRSDPHSRAARRSHRRPRRAVTWCLACRSGSARRTTWRTRCSRRARADRAIEPAHLHRAHARSRPAASGDLQQRLLEPIIERLFGDYPELAYASALRAARLPANVRSPSSTCRPAVARTTRQRPAALTRAQLHPRRPRAAAARRQRPRPARRSRGRHAASACSCNPDVTLDILPALSRCARRETACDRRPGQLRELPFMPGEAELAGRGLRPRAEAPATSSGCSRRRTCRSRDADHAIGLRAAEPRQGRRHDADRHRLDRRRLRVRP